MYELSKEKFGAFVARLRREKGYTQRQLAERLQISDKAVSKWETGVTIPDTALLIPLSQLLDVTVTELLLGERMEPQPLSSEAVEDIVKTAITYTEAAPVRAWQEKSRWGMAFALCALAEAALLLLLWRRGGLDEATLSVAGISAAFAAYFCFFVRTRLPGYYDQNRISGVMDGAFRMNLIGVHFNNRNWPHVVKAARTALLSMMLALPLLSLLLSGRWAAWWPFAELFLLLGGLFAPLYWAARKYE